MVAGEYINHYVYEKWRGRLFFKAWLVCIFNYSKHIEYFCMHIYMETSPVNLMIKNSIAECAHGGFFKPNWPHGQNSQNDIMIVVYLRVLGSLLTF